MRMVGVRICARRAPSVMKYYVLNTLILDDLAKRSFCRPRPLFSQVIIRCNWAKLGLCDLSKREFFPAVGIRDKFSHKGI